MKERQRFVGYEYKEVITNPEIVSFLIDGYKNFGWMIDDNINFSLNKNIPNPSVHLRLKRDRKIMNKTELTRLQRNFESCIREIESLEKSKVSKAIMYSIATGVCPLLIMSTAVSILSLGGYDEMMIANLIAFILLIGVIQLLWVAHSIVKPIQKAEECMIQLAEGKLDISIDEKMKKRDDEIGSMSIALITLSEKLKYTMSDIQTVAEKLVNSEDVMEKMVEEANIFSGQIETATSIISDDAKRQYEDMNEASKSIDEIGSLITSIVGGVNHLEETSSRMKDDGKQSVEIMKDLDKSNERTNQAIERINKQVHLTYDASVQINGVIQMITAISKQTVLLALNASIEAARAGEHGKGFSVVAEEISKLANQSSESVKEIDSIFGGLSIESGKMLEIMNEVLKDVEKQREKLIETQGHFEKVNDGIGVSLEEIIEIKNLTQTSDTARDNVIKAIDGLRLTAEESVYTTNDTRTSVIELNQNITEIESTAELLKEYAETLNNQVLYFSVR